MHVMWNRGEWKSPLFQILALLASRRHSDRPNRVLRALLQFICFLWFLYFVFIIIWFFGLHSLYNLFCPALVVCKSLFIFVSGRSNLFIFLCTTIWSWRIKSLAAFRLAFSWISFKAPISLCIDFFDCADNAQLQPFYKRAFIESLPTGKPTGAAVDSCCTL
mgnify:CR=1 FL=1